MHSTTLLSTIPMVLSLFTTQATACMPDASSSSDNIQFGPDTPSDPATIGYFTNHLSLNVLNLTSSLDFYTRVLGFRHLFTLQATEHVSIAYIAHSQGGRNGTGYMSTAELNRDKNNLAGLIEMVHVDVPDQEHLKPSSERASTVGHVGLVVPDVQATQERLDTFPDVEILKRMGDPTPSEGKIATANGFAKEAMDQISDEERKLIQATLSTINERFIFVADPDGNIIEIQPQD